MTLRARTFPGTLWLLGFSHPPLSEVFERFRETEPRSSMYEFYVNTEDHDAHARLLTLRDAPGEDDYSLVVHLVSPRLLWELAVHRREDVVIVQEFSLAALYAVISKLFRHRRVVCLVEAHGAHHIPLPAWKRAFRRLLARYIDVFAVNGGPAHRYVAEDLGVPTERIVQGWWLAGLPDAERWRRRRQARTRGDSLTILTASRLLPSKGVSDLLRALAECEDGVAGPFRLRIAGEGPQEPELRALARDLGVSDVEFLGHLSRDQLGRALSETDLFVFPSRRDLIGRAVVEAISVGVPVIVNDVSDAAGDLVIDGINGLVTTGSVPSLSAALHTASERRVLANLEEGARATSERVSTEAAADVIASAVRKARDA